MKTQFLILTVLLFINTNLNDIHYIGNKYNLIYHTNNMHALSSIIPNGKLS